MLDDQTLGLRIRSGDESALGLLMKRHKNWIQNKAFNMLGNVEDAEEACIGAFELLWRNRKKWNPEKGQYGGFLKTSITNFLISKYRKQKVENERMTMIELADPDSFLDWLPSYEFDPLSEILDIELSEFLYDALIEIHRREHRMAFILRYLEHYSLAEIARILKTKIGTVKVWAYRGKAELQEILGGYYEN